MLLWKKKRRSKRKEKIERTDQIIENPSVILQRQMSRNEELTKLILEKYVICNM